jgi:hypothetical protein
VHDEHYGPVAADGGKNCPRLAASTVQAAIAAINTVTTPRTTAT